MLLNPLFNDRLMRSTTPSINGVVRQTRAEKRQGGVEGRNGRGVNGRREWRGEARGVAGEGA